MEKKGDRFMFPPETIAATFFPLNLLSFIIAANTIALDISTTIFILSENSCEASIIYSSDTNIISLINSFKKEKVISPIQVLTPSAKVRGGYCG